MLTDSAHLLANHVDIEPPVFQGCSASELLALLVLGMLGWPAITVPLGVAIGWPLLGLGVLGLCVLATIYVGAHCLKRVKRNRPYAYYYHATWKALDRMGVVRAPFVWRSGVWDLGRSD